MKRWVRLGYCPRCGKDVDADYCDDCGTYTQEPEQDDVRCRSTNTSVKRDIDLKSFDRLRKRQKVRRVQKRIVDDRPERQSPE